MSSKKNRRSKIKQHCLEQLEQRIALTAQAVTDVVEAPGPQPQQQVEVTTLLNDANQATGVQYVHENYGFNGDGQTVAVIDSGIAWDHYALGGGYGEDYRVVGGWDFAENDANPYDDGPAGYHGTHVSGIIGSSDEVHTGVASGTDLVALRVFDDYGRSDFSWIESALRWVHEHKDDYANPITTVNLSLGVAWNSDNVPQWAQLEDEFALLEADGIFISVAAGNGFQQYQTPGLSYPAASPHVVPVASHDTDGGFSDFSQRNDRVLVAPGQDIFSTVPDHLFGGFASGKFLKGSGTSMAAPYVAGASTLVREAFSFMGQHDLKQDDIYRHFQETATRFYDSTTNAWYDRINVRAAIDAIVTDRHADSFSNATDLGRLSDTLAADGTIGKFTDTDAFSFVADADGTVTLEFSQTHDLQTKFTLDGHSFEIDGNQITFDVAKGQQYRFSMETLAGIGHYQIDLSLQATSQNHFEATDWGAVTDSTFSTGAIHGENWYRVSANQNGIVSAIGQFAPNENLQFEFYDANFNQVATANGQNGTVRLDATFSRGQEFYLKVTGNSSELDVRMVNLVNFDSGLLSINGTDDSDNITVTDHRPGSFTVILNDVAYQFNHADIQNVVINGGAGNDKLDLRLSSTDDNVTVSPHAVTVANHDYQLDATGFSNITVRNQGGGDDSITLNDSDGNDWLLYNHFQTRLSGAGFTNRVLGFTDITVNATQGYDYASFYGSTGVEHFESNGSATQFETANRSITANGFNRIYVNGGGGQDQFRFTGTASGERFDVGQERIQVDSDSGVIVARGFESIDIDGGGGHDELHLSDSQTSDNVTVSQDLVRLTGGYSFTGKGLENVSVKSHHGNDQITIAGTAGADHVKMTPTETTLSSGLFDVSADGFSRVIVQANQSDGDTLVMIGSAGNDRVYWMANQTVMIGQGFFNRAYGFENISIDSKSGSDSAYITGSHEAEQLRITRHLTHWQGESFAGQLQGIERIRVSGNGQNDRVVMEGFGDNDWLQGNDRYVRAYLNSVSVFVQDFQQVDVYSLANQTGTADIDAVDYVFNLQGDWDEV